LADKILRWYIDGSISRVKTWVGGTYTLDADYRITQIDQTVREVGAITQPQLIDINADGISIFTNPDNRPAILPRQYFKTWTTIPDTILREGSVITLDIDQVFEETPCRDLTVEVRLEQV
jgi:hypothetical protein